MLFGVRVTLVLEPDVPLPVKLTVWGALSASSEILREAVRVPKPVGEKFTLILHCAPGASELGQLLVCAKSVAFVPLIAMLLIVSVLLPVFFSCTPFAPLVVPTV